MLLFPLRGKPGKDRLLERLLHHRKSVEGDGNVATLRRWLGQTTTSQQRQDQSRYSEKREFSRNSVSHKGRKASCFNPGAEGVERLYHRLGVAGNSFSHRL